MADNSAAQLPYLFRQIEAVSSERHRELRLNKIGYDFAAEAGAVPLGLNEFSLAGHDYPIVFTNAEEPTAVAVLGYRRDVNLFVDAAGNWRDSVYIPAYLRAYPFTMVDVPEQSRFVLCFDSAAAAVGSPSGEPLFNNAEPTPRLNEILAFCEALATSLRRMQNFGKELVKAKLLQPHEATLTLGDGATHRIGGFLAVDRNALDQLPDRKFLDFRRRGMLPLIEAHINSLDRWSMLSRVATQRLTAAA